MTKDLPIDERTKEMLDREFGMPSEKDRYLEFARSYALRGDGEGVLNMRPVPVHNVRTENGKTYFTLKFTKKDGFV